jgi:uncharacterized integral membrane protein (TIGR00698 family)
MISSSIALGTLDSSRIARLAPGVLLAGAIAIVALGIESVERAVLGQPIIEALVAAILVGVLLRNLVRLPGRVDLGAAFAAKQILEFGVFLLGATIDVHQVLAAGPALLVAIGAGIVGGITVSYVLGRTIGLHGKLALLVGVGNSICGNSAIAAVAPVVGADKKDVASSIALTAVIGVAMVLLLPLLVPLIHLTHYQYGVLVGMTIYAVPQVIAASFPVSQLSGQVATLVKLVRVLFLGPVVLVLGLIHRGQPGVAAAGKRPALVPWFVVGFLALATLRFAGFVPSPVIAAASDASRWLTILAMAGLGLGVEFAAIQKVGTRVAVAVLGSLGFLIAWSLSLILGLRIGG